MNNTDDSIIEETEIVIKYFNGSLQESNRYLHSAGVPDLYWLQNLIIRRNINETFILKIWFVKERIN